MLHNAKNDLSSVVKLCTFAHILDIGLGIVILQEEISETSGRLC